MILCITPNPAIDRTLILPNLVLGKVHRAEKVIVAAGGKGLNVARAVYILGGQAMCMGFVGGHNGRLLADLAQNEGINTSWTWINSETRTCTILISQNGDATLINEPGIPGSTADWARLQVDVREHIPAAGQVCICGSLPPNSTADDLHKLLGMLMSSGKQVWADTSGIALDTLLTYPGICIKVNGDEIGKSIGFEVNDVPSAKRALMDLIKRGIAACIVTLGAGGALLATQIGRWYVQPPSVRVVSTVGSGDSFLGGFLNALDNGRDWSEALCEAVAAGTANALSEGGGKFRILEFKEIQSQVKVESW